MRMVLASESQSRGRALDILEVAYEVFPSAIYEKAIRDSDPAALTKKLAEAKRGGLLAKFGPRSWSQAVVAKDGKIFEKLPGIEEAASFLRELCASVFWLVTSLIVLRVDSKRMPSTVENSEIRFRWQVEREIRDSVSRHPVLRFAGAFEGEGGLRFADSVSGGYPSITALPVSRLAVFLREQGIEV